MKSLFRLFQNPALSWLLVVSPLTIGLGILLLTGADALWGFWGLDVVWVITMVVLSAVFLSVGGVMMLTKVRASRSQSQGAQPGVISEGIAPVAPPEEAQGYGWSRASDLGGSASG